MANNRVQVKRTNTSGLLANVTDPANTRYIAAGEFALNMADGILYTSNGSAIIEVGANNTNQRITNSLTVNNSRNLNFQTVNTSAAVYFTQQNDDNFVLYSTNTVYGARPVFGVFANSITSNLQIYIPLQFNSGVVANNSLGSAGQVLTTNSTGVYWSSVGGSGTVTSVATGNGMTGGPITTTGTVSVLANNGIVANSTGVFAVSGLGTVVNSTGINVNANNGITATAAGVFVNGNSGLTVNSTGVHVLANNGIVANSTGVFVNGNTGTVVNSTGVFVNATYIGTLSANNASFLGGTAAASFVQNTDSRTLSGNLIISGTYFNPSANTIALGNTTARWVLVANSGDFSSTVNAVTSVNSALLTVGASFIANTTGAYHTGTVNAASHTVGTSTIANSTGVYAGVVNATTHSSGTGFTANSILVNAAAINIVGQVNTATLYATTSANVASAVQANSTGIWTTGTVNGATISVGTSFVANTSRLVLGTAVGLQANGSIGSSGQVLTSNGTTAYWATSASGGGSTYMKGGSATVGSLATEGQNIFRVNANTLNFNTTFVAGENAQATGPIAVASGITLTVESGARVSII